MSESEQVKPATEEEKPGTGGVENLEEKSGVSAKVRDALTAVLDPEMGFNVVELGLIYGIEEAEAGKVAVRMTLTSPMCPVGPEIISAAKVAALNVEEVEEADIQLVWTPPWDPKKHASEEVKGMFGIWE